MSSADLLDSIENLRRRVLENFKRYGDLRFQDGIEWYRVDSEKSSPVIGVDSSHYSKTYKYIYLYIIRGVSVPRSTDQDLRYCIKSYSYSDAYFIALPADENSISSLVSEELRKTPPPVKELKKILSHRARDLEVKVGYEAYECSLEKLSNSEPLILMDGSARSFLPLRFKSGSHDIFSELKRSWKQRLEIIRRISERGSIVFISKTQSRTYYSDRLKPYLKEDGRRVGVLVPDVILIDSYLTMKNVFRNGIRVPGFSEPILYRNRDPPQDITIFYAVFQSGGGMYQVSLLGKHDNELDHIRSLYERIKFWSISGYPEPLREAHHMSMLRHSDITKLLNMSCLFIIESGREALDT